MNLPLPKSQRVRRVVSKLCALTNRQWYNGQQPIHGLWTLIGKAERLERGHVFRKTVARVVRRYFSLREKQGRLA